MTTSSRTDTKRGLKNPGGGRGQATDLEPGHTGAQIVLGIVGWLEESRKEFLPRDRRITHQTRTDTRRRLENPGGGRVEGTHRGPGHTGAPSRSRNRGLAGGIL